MKNLDPANVYLGSDFVCLDRVEIDRASVDSPILQADISSITRTIYQGATAGSPTSVTIGSAVYNSLQVPTATANTIWTKDDIGFNFKDRVPQSSITAAGQWYVKYTFTLTGGTQFVRWFSIWVANPPTP